MRSACAPSFNVTQLHPYTDPTCHPPPQVLHFAKEVFDRIFVPPVCGVLAGLVSSSIPPIYYLFCGGPYPDRLPRDVTCPESSAPLGAVMSGLKVRNRHVTVI